MKGFADYFAQTLILHNFRGVNERIYLCGIGLFTGNTILIFCSATEMAGGLDAAIPHQAAVIKLGFSPTIAPTNTAGIGYSSVCGPSFNFSIVIFPFLFNMNKILY